MATRKKQQIAASSFETDHKNWGYVRIFADMYTSPAWHALSDGAKNLYLGMKLIKGTMSGEDKETLYKKYGNNDDSYFYFSNQNWYKGGHETNRERLNLYSNKQSYLRDRQALVDKGFITIVENNANLRKRNVYRFIDKWKEHKEKP